MNYTLENIIKNQDIRLSQQNDQFEVFKIQESINGLNNQNRIGWEFVKSKYYIQNNRIEDFKKHFEYTRGEDIYKKTMSLWHIPQDGNMNLDRRISKLSHNEIKLQDIEPYFKYLAWHISIDLAKNPNYTPNYFPTRWGWNKIFGGNDLEEFNYVKQNINLINEKLKEDSFEWETLNMDWHKFLSFSWALIQCGLGKYALEIVNPLFELHIKEYKENKSAMSFVMGALFQDYKLRIKGTLSWIKSFSHKQVGEMSEYYNTLNSYVEYYEEVGCYHYNVTNRVLEASVLVFKHKPTLDNRERCLKLFKHSCSLFMDEPTECVRERGLIVYDFAKTLFKKDYEEYNS